MSACLLHGQDLWVLCNWMVRGSGFILVNDCNLARIVQGGWTGAGKIGFLFLWRQSRIGAVLAAPLWKVWVLPSFYISTEILSGLSTVELDTYTEEPSILRAWACVNWSLDLWILVHKVPGLEYRSISASHHSLRRAPGIRQSLCVEDSVFGQQCSNLTK